jgi:hypothetical protein
VSKAVLVVALAALAGCGSDPPPRHHIVPAARLTPLKSSHCPPGATNCKTASGQIIYVEAVDPDGDGDAHFVLASEDGISAPGITSIDVEKELRPRRLPRVGDAVAAAGPVYRGSYGQRQIQAVKLRIRRVP